MKLTDIKNTKVGLPERVRQMFRKHKMAEILKHLPIIAEILIEGVGMNVPGATMGFIRLMRAFGKGEANEGREEMAEFLSDHVVSILATQKQLVERCNMLEEENANIKGEVARSVQQLVQLKAEMQTTKAAVESLQKRNVYFSWGLLAVGVLAVSELGWILVH